MLIQIQRFIELHSRQMGLKYPTFMPLFYYHHIWVTALQFLLKIITLQSLNAQKVVRHLIRLTCPCFFCNTRAQSWCIICMENILERNMNGPQNITFNPVGQKSLWRLWKHLQNAVNCCLSTFWVFQRSPGLYFSEKWRLSCDSDIMVIHGAVVLKSWASASGKFRYWRQSLY